MEKSIFTLILTEPNGNFAVPDLQITQDFETAFSITSASDISKRNDSISKELSFPGTKNNNRIFNSMFSFNRDSDSTLVETLFFNYSPNRGVRAVLYENNEAIMAGELRINAVTKDRTTGAFSYVGLIVGNLVSFFGKLRDQLLTELPGFSEVVTFSWKNVVDSWTFNPDKKYLFPMIDYGMGIIPRRDKFDLRNLRPGVYVRQYIKQILASQGYRYKSDFIDSDIFNRAYIPYSDKDFGYTAFGDFLTVLGGAKSVPLNRKGSKYSSTAVSFNMVPADDKIITTTPDTITVFKNGNPDVLAQGTGFTFKRTTTTAAEVELNFTVNSNSNVGNMHIGIYEVANVRAGIDSPFDEKYFEFAGNKDITQTIKLKLPLTEYHSGFKFMVLIYVYGKSTIDYNQHSASIKFGNPDVSVGTIANYEFGETFQLNSIVPKNQKSSDMLKSILQFFNMYMIENPDNDKELIIEPYDVFYYQTKQPQLYALDWSKKVDSDSLKMGINISMPKSYNFKFKEDSDYYSTLYKTTYNKNYGDLTIQNRNGSVDAKNIESLFSSTVVAKENGDDKTLPAIYGGEIGGKKSMKSNLRILFNNGSAPCQPFDIALTSPDGNDSSIAYYDNKQTGIRTYNISHNVLTLGGVDVFNLLFGLPDAVYYDVTGSIFDLPTIYSEMYANQLAELNDDDIFTLELNCHLNELDVKVLDLRRPIFIATPQGLAYFKIMNVAYYSSQELSKVTLQKIIL